MDAKNTLQSLLDQLNRVIVGKPEQVFDCVTCLLAGGHLLIEDVPGVGKTTLAHALARTLGLQFARVQFTSDLMPSDVTGVSVYERSQEYLGRSLPRYSWPTKSTAPAPRPKVPCWRPWKSAKSLLKGSRIRCPSLFMSLPPRIRMTNPEPMPCRHRKLTAF